MNLLIIYSSCNSLTIYSSCIVIDNLFILKKDIYHVQYHRDCSFNNEPRVAGYTEVFFLLNSHSHPLKSLYTCSLAKNGGHVSPHFHFSTTIHSIIKSSNVVCRSLFLPRFDSLIPKSRIFLPSKNSVASSLDTCLMISGSLLS